MEFPLKLQPSYNQILTPTNIAIFSSVGLHAVILGFMLPNLSEWSKSSQKGDQQNVGVIELNEAEQSRLPNTSPFSGENPFFPSTSALPNPLPNDPLLANPGLTIPPIPELPPPIANYNYFSNQAPLTPPPPYGYSSNWIELNKTPIVQPPPPPSQKTSTNHEVSTKDYFGSVKRNQNNASRSIDFGKLSEPKGTGFIDDPSQRMGNTNATNLSGTSSSSEFGADTQETTSDQSIKKYLEWKTKLLANGSSGGDGILKVVLPYPRQACLTRAEGRVGYGVVPSGEVTLFQASRYSIFNQLAQQFVQSQRFAQPTSVIVDFKYDPKVCASTFTAPNTHGSQNQNPNVAPSGLNNAGENVYPADNPNAPRTPSLDSGSNTPNSAPATLMKQPSIAPSPGSVPSEAATTTTNPSTLKTPSQNSPPPQNTQNSSSESLKEPKTQTQPVEQPMVKPTSSVDTPKAPSEVKPASTPNVQSSPVPTNESLLEKIRKSLFQRQGTKNQEATPSKPTPSSTESQKPGNGSSGTMTNNTIGPSVGKKE